MTETKETLESARAAVGENSELVVMCADLEKCVDLCKVKNRLRYAEEERDILRKRLKSACVPVEEKNSDPSKEETHQVKIRLRLAEEGRDSLARQVERREKDLERAKQLLSEWEHKTDCLRVELRNEKIKRYFENVSWVLAFVPLSVLFYVLVADVLHAPDTVQECFVEHKYGVHVLHGKIPWKFGSVTMGAFPTLEHAARAAEMTRCPLR
jgi:hypothetical protein